MELKIDLYDAYCVQQLIFDIWDLIPLKGSMKESNVEKLRTKLKLFEEDV